MHIPHPAHCSQCLSLLYISLEKMHAYFDILLLYVKACLTVCVAGVNTLGDLGRMLEGLPRPFVDFLKVQAIIRGAATKLGSSLHDRLRINATYALKVIPPAYSASFRKSLLLHLSGLSVRSPYT